MIIRWKKKNSIELTSEGDEFRKPKNPSVVGGRRGSAVVAWPSRPLGFLI